MQDVLDRYRERIFALMRIVAGFLFLCHGAQKLFGIFGGNQVSLVSLMGLAGIIEFFGGLLIMIGLFTNWVAFICAGQMAVAYFMVHLPRGFVPIRMAENLRRSIPGFFSISLRAQSVSGVWTASGRSRKQTVSGWGSCARLTPALPAPV